MSLTITRILRTGVRCIIIAVAICICKTADLLCILKDPIKQFDLYPYCAVTDAATIVPVCRSQLRLSVSLTTHHI